MRPEEQLQRYALTIDRVRLTADPAPGFHYYHALAFRVRDADREGGGPRYLPELPDRLTFVISVMAQVGLSFVLGKLKLCPLIR